MGKDTAIVLLIAFGNILIIESNYTVIPGTICAPGVTICSAAYPIELSRRLAELPCDNIRKGVHYE